LTPDDFPRGETAIVGIDMDTARIENCAFYGYDSALFTRGSTNVSVKNIHHDPDWSPGMK